MIQTVFLKQKLCFFLFLGGLEVGLSGTAFLFLEASAFPAAVACTFPAAIFAPVFFNARRSAAVIRLFFRFPMIGAISPTTPVDAPDLLPNCSDDELGAFSLSSGVNVEAGLSSTSHGSHSLPVLPPLLEMPNCLPCQWLY
jgi:hypothetical protein